MCGEERRRAGVGVEPGVGEGVGEREGEKQIKIKYEPK